VTLNNYSYLKLSKILYSLDFFLSLHCRGGDSTQRDARATVLLEPHGAAASNVTLHSNQYFRRSGKECTSMCALPLPSSMMAIREYWFELRRLMMQDLCFV